MLFSIGIYYLFTDVSESIKRSSGTLASQRNNADENYSLAVIAAIHLRVQGPNY